MRKSLIAFAAATIAVAAVTTPTTADARWRGWGGPALGGLIAGALIGSAFARPSTAMAILRTTATDIRRTTATVIRRTAIAIRRTTVMETGIISATTARVTKRTASGTDQGARRENPRGAFLCAF
jgi:predicted lipid-binding transport protein (Tim44 family)